MVEPELLEPVVPEFVVPLVDGVDVDEPAVLELPDPVVVELLVLPDDGFDAVALPELPDGADAAPLPLLPLELPPAPFTANSCS